MHKQMQRKKAIDNNEEVLEKKELEKKEKEKHSHEQMQRKNAMHNNEEVLRSIATSKCRGRTRCTTTRRC